VARRALINLVAAPGRIIWGRCSSLASILYAEQAADLQIWIGCESPSAYIPPS
jgi:hypothetical protein